MANISWLLMARLRKALIDAVAKGMVALVGKIPMKSSIFEGFLKILLGWSKPILSAKVADFQMWDKILQDDLLIKVGHFFLSTIFLNGHMGHLGTLYL